MRTFISINIDNTVKECLLEIQSRLKKQISVINKSFLKSIKWTEKDKFHLTLFFIGEVSEKILTEIDNCLSGIKTGNFTNGITLSFNSIDAFPNLRYPRVLMVEIISEDNNIVTLSQEISNAIMPTRFENDRNFHPHFTLGRIKRNSKINLTGLTNEYLDANSFTVHKFQLMKSKLTSSGAEYTVLKEYNIS